MDWLLNGCFPGDCLVLASFFMSHYLCLLLWCLPWWNEVTFFFLNFLCVWMWTQSLAWTKKRFPWNQNECRVNKVTLTLVWYWDPFNIFFNSHLVQINYSTCRVKTISFSLIWWQLWLTLSETHVGIGRNVTNSQREASPRAPGGSSSIALLSCGDVTPRRRSCLLLPENILSPKQLCSLFHQTCWC